MAGEDRRWSNLIRQMACAMCGSPPPNEQHHKSGAGMGLRAHDHQSMPLCRDCHHVRLGEMPKAERREFEGDAIAALQLRLSVHTGAEMLEFPDEELF